MHQSSPSSQNHAKVFRLTTVLFLALCVFFCSIFTALGVWQLQRLKWKEALIERVETRIKLPPMAAPPASQWDNITALTHEYRLLPDTQVLVSALTDYGSGYWLMQALALEDGSRVFINRGFVPMDWKIEDHSKEDEETIQITGLLRLSEGAGFFPRRNDPANNRWYSRQIEAFAKARNLENTAPYFIDANATADMHDENAPIGGLTIVNFRNTHLSHGRRRVCCFYFSACS